MKRHNIPHCSIREIDRNGIAHCMEKILDMINPSGNRPLHLSFDIDSVDPGIAPSTGTKVRGGLSYREAMYVCEEVARTGSLSVMDLVEVNPELGTPRESRATVAVAVDIIAHALGLSIRDTDYRRFPHN
uniref:Arginase n=1 Tax=Ciona savignyi TaxID=51511 RepID=H2Z512_CIOSA